MEAVKVNSVIHGNWHMSWKCASVMTQQRKRGYMERKATPVCKGTRESGLERSGWTQDMSIRRLSAEKIGATQRLLDISESETVKQSMPI